MKRIGNWGGNRSGLGAGLLGMAALVLGACLPAPVLWSEDAAQGTQAARLSSVDGQVQISQGAQVLADQAVANTPLFEGTLVTTADDGRAEIQFDDGSVARLSPNSSLALTVLRGQGASGDVDIALESGLSYFELQGGVQSGRTRVHFSDSVVTASGFSVLRINLDNPPGELAVFSGNAHMERGNALSLDLHGGESVAPSGSDPGRYSLAESIEPDSWDAWNADRDQALTSQAAEATGATKGLGESGNPAWNDLDANGNWYNVPDQGYIWSPYEAANPGWDPYGSGYWMWTPGYGDIWVSGYGWGYMPYQCGMWNYYNDFGWGWMPGRAGCMRWWGMGFYGGPNIGMGYGGYRPPTPPHRRLGGGRTLANGGERGGPHPVIAVNRRQVAGAAPLPSRERAAPVVIAGHTVQALHPLVPRPQYERSASGFVTRTGTGYTVTGQGPRTAGGPGSTAVPGSSGSRASGSSAPRASGGGGSQRAPAPASHSSSGGGYSGGGGGGASHVSSGGGGAAASGGGAPAGTHR